MPLPRFEDAAAAEQQPARPGANHYFGTAHGDVAALHARIEHGFASYAFGDSPHSRSAALIESGVQILSRGAGIVGFVAALGVVIYALI